jgi:acyl-CoA reductase-like NAD-dependent aldehyde dehydrogenase
VALTGEYRFGNPLLPETNLGPMVKATAADFVRKRIVDAVTAGANARIPDGYFAADAPGTACLPPQVLAGVDHSMRVMTEESFGRRAGSRAKCSSSSSVARRCMAAIPTYRTTS